MLLKHQTIPPISASTLVYFQYGSDQKSAGN